MLTFFTSPPKQSTAELDKILIYIHVFFFKVYTKSSCTQVIISNYWPSRLSHLLLNPIIKISFVIVQQANPII